MRRLCGVLLLFCASLAGAQDRPLPWELRLEGARESLDRGFEDWDEAVAQLSWRPRAGLALLAGARRTERFGLRDDEGFAGAYLPLGDAYTLHAEASASRTHRVLPRRAGVVEVSRKLGDGWVASLGFKAARYDLDRTEGALATIEKYHGPFRIAYSASVARPEGAGWAPAHRLSATWYRGELTYVTLSGGRGRELENVPGLGLLTTDVRHAAIGAGFELAPNVGLGAEASWTRQGDLYTRRAARLAARILF